MSLRQRELATAPDPAGDWADTLDVLVERHRRRRAAHDAARWPLAHACSHLRGAPTNGAVDRVDDARDSGDQRVTRYAFCCRALA